MCPLTSSLCPAGSSQAAAAATKGSAGYAPSGLGASFSKGGFESTVDGTNAAVASTYAAPQEPEEQPPLPPPPSLVPDYSEQPPLPQQSSAPQQLPQQSTQPLQHPHHLQQHQSQQQPQQQQQQPVVAASYGLQLAAATQASVKSQAPPPQVQGSFSGFKGMYTNRFGTSFVSSGAQGGDQHARATIIAPKQQAQKTFVPAPIPVTERPLFNRPGGQVSHAFACCACPGCLCVLAFGAALAFLHEMGEEVLLWQNLLLCRI